MTLADQILENKIHFAYLAFAMATSKEAMREAQNKMAELIAQRTPEVVREMEQRKGIAR